MKILSFFALLISITSLQAQDVESSIWYMGMEKIDNKHYIKIDMNYPNVWGNSEAKEIEIKSLESNEVLFDGAVTMILKGSIFAAIDQPIASLNEHYSPFGITIRDAETEDYYTYNKTLFQPLRVKHIEFVEDGEAVLVTFGDMPSLITNYPMLELLDREGKVLAGTSYMYGLMETVVLNVSEDEIDLSEVAQVKITYNFGRNGQYDILPYGKNADALKDIEIKSIAWNTRKDFSGNTTPQFEVEFEGLKMYDEKGEATVMYPALTIMDRNGSILGRANFYALAPIIVIDTYLDKAPEKGTQLYLQLNDQIYPYTIK